MDGGQESNEEAVREVGARKMVAGSGMVYGGREVFHWLQSCIRCLDHGDVVSRKREEFN